MSLPESLARNTLDRIVKALELQEVVGPNGGAYRNLESAAFGGNVGAAHLFVGGPIAKVVTIDLVVPAIGLDSHMLFAYSKPHSAIPHLTLDSVSAGGGFAFHLDLVPRVELASHRQMLDQVMHPLTPTYEAGRAIEGLTSAHLTPRQYALMSPWMLAFRATVEAFQQIHTPVDAYTTHWLHLVKNGLPNDVMTEIDIDSLPGRNARHLASLFDPDIDPVWNQVDRLVGATIGADLRKLLANPEAPGLA